MIYQLTDGQLAPARALDEGAQQVIVISAGEFEDHAGLVPGLSLHTFLEHTQTVRQPGCVYGAIAPPHLEHKRKSQRGVFFFISKNKLLIAAETAADCGALNESVTRDESKRSLHRVAYQFFNDVFQSGADQLLDIENRIDALEDAVLAGKGDQFAAKMSVIRRQIRQLHLFYERAQDMAEVLIENEYEVLDEDVLPAFRQLADYIARLSGGTQMLREYALQVEDMHQSQIDIRQNKIMQLLTVVTTIFFPLSLITGWYGMNVKGIPEYDWDFGYVYVILLSLLVIGLCTWWFRKKKYL